MSETTVPHVDVIISVASTCPKCGKRVEVRNTLDYNSIVTGNTTQRAAYWADSMVREVNAEIARRGWTDVRCGACRDTDGVVAAKEVKNPLANPANATEGDHECG